MNFENQKTQKRLLLHRYHISQSQQTNTIAKANVQFNRNIWRKHSEKNWAKKQNKWHNIIESSTFFQIKSNIKNS